MKLKRLIAFIVIAALAILPIRAIEAGGWASVEIVDGPGSLAVGVPVTLALLIQQHGIAPIDVDALVITATNAESDESIEETATHGDGTGRYSVELTFPAEGSWNLEGTPGGFPPFDMGQIEVGATSATTALVAPAGVATIAITGGMGSGQFGPGRLKVARGTLIVWTNDSTEGHTVVLDDKFNSSGLIAPGAAFAMLFDEPGTYQYSCGPHPNMSGTIIVS